MLLARRPEQLRNPNPNLACAPCCRRVVSYTVTKWRNNKLVGSKVESDVVRASRSVVKVRADSAIDEDMEMMLNNDLGGAEEEDDTLGDILTSGLEEGVADIIRADDMYEMEGE